MIWSYLLLTAMLLPLAVGGAKILMVAAPVTSQCLMTGTLGKELKSRGHDVTVYLPDHFDPKTCFGGTEVAIRKYPTLPEHKRVVTEDFQKLTKSIFDGSGGPLSFFRIMGDLIGAICNPLLSSDLDKLKAEGYDLVIVNPNPPMRCLPFVPLYLGVPFVTMGTVVDPFEAMDPFPAYYKTHIFTTLPNTRTFSRRLLSTLSWLASRLLMSVFDSAFDRGLTSSLPYTPTTASRHSSLFLEVTDHVIMGPRAAFPNLVQVGALTARPPKPLTPDLEKFFQSADRGVLVVAFGSIINHVPDHSLDNLIRTLKRLNYKVLLAFPEEREEANIKMVKWIPQNDVLGHAKTRAFLSHCGLSSYSEALYHGVPVVCSPLNADAFAIANRVVRMNIGAKVDILTDSSDAMLTTLTSALENPDIKSNMTRMSLLLRDRPETPAARAAHAVEHVIKYGGAHLRPDVDEDLCVTSYLLLDVWFALLCIVVAAVSLPVLVCRCLCCRKKGAGKENVSKEKKKKGD